VFTDESVRSACAYTLQAIGQHNQDILKEYSSDVIPLAFFAMHASKNTGKVMLLALILTISTLHVRPVYNGHVHEYVFPYS
jgi:hypothetical protein